MAVLDVVSVIWLEVGVETPLVLAHGQIPFGFGGETVRFHVDAVATQGALQEVGTPVAESVGLFPAYSDNGILAVTAVAEIHTDVGFVVGVLEVVYPAGGVGIYIYYICIEEIIVTRQTA